MDAALTDLQFTGHVSALRHALKSLSKTACLVLEPDSVPHGLDIVNPLSAVEVLGTNIDTLRTLKRSWKKFYFTKIGTGFEYLEYKNRGKAVNYIIWVQTSSLQLQSVSGASDIAEFIVQRDSQEHRDLLREYKRALEVDDTSTRAAPLPAVVSPAANSSTHTSSSSTQFSFEEAPLQIITTNIINKECGHNTNCITPTNEDECSGSNDYKQYVHPNLFDDFIQRSKDEPNVVTQVNAALKTLFWYINNHQNEELPDPIQAFLYHSMLKCNNKDNIYTIKQCSAPNTQLRLDKRFFQHVPKGRDGKGQDNKKTVAKKADAIYNQLELTTKNDQEQMRQILDAAYSRVAPKPTAALVENQETFSSREHGINRRKYWLSKAAFNLFGTNKHSCDEDVNELGVRERLIDDCLSDTGTTPPRPIFAETKSIVRKRIDLLRKVFTTIGGHKLVLSKQFHETLLPDRARFQITLRSRYLVAALETALLEMPRLIWKLCCQKAVDEVNASEGTDHITDPRTVMKWYKKFRSEYETFDCLASKTNETRTPDFFKNNPDAQRRIEQFALNTLNKLTMESLHDYIHSVLLPDLRDTKRSERAEILKEEGIDEERIATHIDVITVDSILAESNLKVLNQETIRNWMHKLGFKYEERKKCFFVDVHEREDVVKDRNIFVKNYLAGELRRHVWIQKRVNEVGLQKLYANGELLKTQGYRFKKDGEEWIEFHVDDHSEFFEEGAKCEYGGNLSVRFPEGENPLIRIGQDEAIFKQYQVTTKAWKGPRGEIGLVPKDDGAGVMISGMISREAGFGFRYWNANLMEEVNELRQGQSYRDEEAAMEVYGRKCKHDLEENPFVHKFEYGANRDGYWNSSHMVCQMENCADVLKVKFPSDKFDIELILDHSQGHDRLRPDGLSVTNMNLLFGGHQPKMRDSELTSEDHFGPFPRSLESFYNEDTRFYKTKKNQRYKDFIPNCSTAARQQLEIGDTQSMYFTAEDEGPFYLTAAEREAYKFDTVTGFGRKEKTADDLRADLCEKFEELGIRNTTCLKKAKKKKLQELALKYDIETSYSCVKVRQGWVGTPKGKLQIMFERGLLDPTKPYNHYSVKGEMDDEGRLIPGTSIDKLIHSLQDFRTEETLLQWHARHKSGDVVFIN